MNSDSMCNFCISFVMQLHLQLYGSVMHNQQNEGTSFSYFQLLSLYVRATSMVYCVISTLAMRVLRLFDTTVQLLFYTYLNTAELYHETQVSNHVVDRGCNLEMGSNIVHHCLNELVICV